MRSALLLYVCTVYEYKFINCNTNACDKGFKT